MSFSYFFLYQLHKALRLKCPYVVVVVFHNPLGWRKRETFQSLNSRNPSSGAKGYVLLSENISPFLIQDSSAMYSLGPIKTAD